MKSSSSSSLSCSSSTALLLRITTTSLLILAFLSFTTNGHYHDHDGDPCSDDFTELVGKRNITFCKKLRTLDAEFGWNYYQNNDGSIHKTNLTQDNTARIDILFRAKLNSHSGWVAWGVNPVRPEMVGTQAIIAIRQSNGTTSADTYNISQETRYGCAIMKPSRNIGVQILKNMSAWSYVNVNNRHTFYVHISATLILPSDAYNISMLNHVWQVGEDALGDDNEIYQHKRSLHNLDSAETVNLTTPTGRSTQGSLDFLRSVHGALSIIGWGTFLPCGAIIARYLRVYPIRWDKMWKILHVGFQSTGFIIGTIAWIIGLCLGHSTKYHVLHTHRTFGILIFVFSTIQMLAFRLKPESTDKYRKYWNMYHHFLGYGLITLIIINIFKGIRILHDGPAWKWIYIGILSFLGCITLVFEIVTWLFFIPEKRDPICIGSKSKEEGSEKKQGEISKADDKNKNTQPVTANQQQQQ